MTAIVAALSHDIGHPALNNNFLIHTQHELALQYMFESPLEKYHIFQTFSILAKPVNNFIAHFPKEDLLTFRTVFSQMILATDNAEHGRYVARLRALNDTEGIVPTGGEAEKREVRYLRPLRYVTSRQTSLLVVTSRQTSNVIYTYTLFPT